MDGVVPSAGGQPDVETEIDEDTNERKSPGQGGLFGGLFNRGDGQNARKTVTFGDASAVRSKAFWSLISLILLIGFWYLATKPFGFPEDFKPIVDQEFQEQYDRQFAKNEERIAEGSPNLIVLPPLTPTQEDYITRCTLDDDDGDANGCNADQFTQLLNSRTLPSPGDTWTTFIQLQTDGFQNVTLFEHSRISLWRVTRGMIFGSLAGIPIGFAMGLSSRLRGFFDTPVELFRPIPPLAILPLFILWFGIGDSTAVNLLIFASLWIMIIAARAGARTVKLSKVRAAYSLGASKTQVLLRVILPNALPELFTGFRVALGVCWGTLVAAELVGANTGLGAMIFTARSIPRIEVVVVGVIVIAVLGVLLDVVLRWIEGKLIPWRGKG